MRAQQPAPGQVNAALLKILELRSGSAYQAAEVIRKRMKSKLMASFPTGSNEYAAVRLLIGTWDSIAMRVRAGEIPKEMLFETSPVLYMWERLRDAVLLIRKSSGMSRGYARDFEWLANNYRRWTQTKAGRHYRSKAAQGIHAQFG